MAEMEELEIIEYEMHLILDMDEANALYYLLRNHICGEGGNYRAIHRIYEALERYDDPEYNGKTNKLGKNTLEVKLINKYDDRIFLSDVDREPNEDYEDDDD